MLNKCKEIGFSEIINKLYAEYDSLLIVSKINNELKIIAPISKSITAIVPYTNDIKILSENIESIKNAYANAQITSKNATISTNAKNITIKQAQEALNSANTAHLSALFAGDRAEWIDENTKPILENLEVIKLSPQNAQIAKESANISTKAKIVTIEQAQKALNSANTAHLSALFAGDRAEHVDSVAIYVTNKKNEVIKNIGQHKDFIELSTLNIETIERLLLEKSQEVEVAKKEAFNSATLSTINKNFTKSDREFVNTVKTIVRAVANETIENKDITKKYRDETLNSGNVVVDLRNETSAFRDESEKYRDEIRDMSEQLKVNGVYDIKKEMFVLRTGMIYETRGDILRP